MKRREFIKSGAGLILSVSAISTMGSLANAATDDETISELERGDNRCHSSHPDDELPYALSTVNPDNLPGIFAKSQGCVPQHTHVVFIVTKYLENPDLIELEADTTKDGAKARTFPTSPPIDMGWFASTFAPRHTHSLILTRADIQELNRNPQGIKRLTDHRGHFFHLKLG